VKRSWRRSIDHSELVFKVCAQSGHLWPRWKLLGGYATA